MIFVYRRPGSEGATELAEALDGRRVRFYQGGGVFKRIADGGRRYPVTAQDVVVCWGERLQGELPEGVRVLNSAPLLNKYEDALKLKEAGVPTVEVSRTRPTPPPIIPQTFEGFEQLVDAAEAFSASPFNRTALPYREGVRDLREKLARFESFLMTPIPPPAPEVTWLGRSFRHVGGNDLLTIPEAPDYFSKKEEIVEEFRVHSFLGKSIKAGVKVVREGVDAPNPWIRSLNGGWRIRYDGFESRKEMREVAAAAVKALGLDFGAVDLGRLRGGGLIVLEVNKAPGLGDGTVNTYARAIRGWRDGANATEEGRA